MTFGVAGPLAGVCKVKVIVKQRRFLQYFERTDLENEAISTGFEVSDGQINVKRASGAGPIRANALVYNTFLRCFAITVTSHSNTSHSKPSIFTSTKFRFSNPVQLA